MKMFLIMMMMMMTMLIIIIIVGITISMPTIITRKMLAPEANNQYPQMKTVRIVLEYSESRLVL